MHKVFQSDEIISDRQLDTQTHGNAKPQATKNKSSHEGVQLSGARVFDYSISDTKTSSPNHAESIKNNNSTIIQSVSQNSKKSHFNFGYAHSTNTSVNITGIKVKTTDSTNYILASTSNAVLNTKTSNQTPFSHTPDVEISNLHQEKSITEVKSEEPNHYIFNDSPTFITPFSTVNSTEALSSITNVENRKGEISPNTKEPAQPPTLKQSSSHARTQDNPFTKSDGLTLGGLDNSMYALGQVSSSKNNIQDTPKITRNPLFEDPTQTQQESKKTAFPSHATFDTHTTSPSTHKIIGNSISSRPTQIKPSSLDTPRVQLQTNISPSGKNKGVSGFKYENRLLCSFDDETPILRK